MLRLLSLILLLVSSACTAQLFPKDGAMLCYRLIGFSFPVQQGAEKYDAAKQQWMQPVELYRASIITSPKDLENLIWNSEK